MTAAIELLDGPEQVRLARSPLRRRLLQRLREPSSATQVAGELGLGRQRVNHHLRALEAGGPGRAAGERQRRGRTERILRTTATPHHAAGG
ncbi:MAG TPA: helix-turn-helix domain-containing protein [Euzebyales bacterium]|nr:helix-turn-helix domain-containing protein [Euzebyales bacterium]